MWRREFTRCVLALNWCLAGLACGMAIYGHDHIWRSICLKVAYQDMVAEGISDPGGNDTWPEWYRRGDVLRAKFAGLDRMGHWGWMLAMLGGAGTAVGLMIAFPKPSGKAAKVNESS